jgi:hypothetical protein
VTQADSHAATAPSARLLDHQPAMMTTVSVNTPYQVVHGGVVYGPGQTVDVPPEVAQTWIDAGWVSETTAEKRATKAAPPKRAR